MTTEVEREVERVRATLGGDELAWLMARVRQQLERGGQGAWGMVRLSGASELQRGAVDRLLGRRPTRGGTLTVDLGALDRRIREAGLAAGLADAVQTLGGPVTDRSAARDRVERRWASVLDDARAAFGAAPVLVDWLDELQRGGLLRRLAGGDPSRGAELVDEALAVLARLPAAGLPLAELAATVTGDSHALDAGRPLATLVVRAAASLGGLETEGSDRRDVWASVGVLCDELSAPVLVLNLRASGGGLLRRVLAEHADAGEPSRLSIRTLLRHPPAFARGPTVPRVFVCENPSVVAAAADRLGAASAPLICLEGQRKTAARLLLRALEDAGVPLAYHGDFDWGGLRIGAAVLRLTAGRPWRFSANDYLDAPNGRPLRGRPADAPWDPALAVTMRARGVAVEEETVLAALLDDLDAS